MTSQSVEEKPPLRVILGLTAGQFVATLSTTVIATALPTISGELGGQSHLSWIASTTLLAATIAGPILGKLADVLGRRWVFLSTALVYVLGAAVAGTSATMEQLIVGLGIQGIGIGGLAIMTQVLLADVTTPRERGKYIGYLIAGYGAAAVSGPLIGGYLVGIDVLGWRLCFLGAIPIAAGVCAAVYRSLPPGGRAEGRSVDLFGMSMLAATTVCFLLVVTFVGREVSWGSPASLAILVALVSFLALLVRAEQRAADPVIPARLLRNRTFLTCAAVSVITSGVMYIALFYLPQFLQIARNVTPERSGTLMLPMLVTQIITAPIVGRITSRHGNWKPLAVTGPVLMTAAFALLGTIRDDSTTTVTIAMMLIGCGLGCTLQSLMAVAQTSSHHLDLGVATSMITFSRSLGSTTGIAIFGAFSSAHISTNLPARLHAAGVENTSPTGIEKLLGTPAAISRLPDDVREAIAGAYATAFHSTFLWATLIVATAPLLVLSLRNVRLGDRSATRP